MNQYQNQYGTVYAVRDYKGAPQIMCRAKDDGDWLISGTLDVQAAAAKTADEMQAVLDQHATAHGWQPVDEQAPASAEPPEIVDEGSGAEAGFPDWVRPMVEAFLRFPFFRELPAFTAFALRHSEPVQHRQGGSLADGLYDTGSKGIKFSVFRGNNSDHYREASYTWADFVRRCKAAGLAPEQLHQDKEDAPCKINPPAPATQPSKEPPVELAPTAPMSLPAFDYSGLDDQTVQDLHLAEREFACGKRMAEIGLRRMADGVAIAHDALCGSCDIMSQLKHGNRGEASFGRWCESVGLNRKAAERLLQVSRLFDQSSPNEEKVLETLGPTLLYAAAKPSAPAELVQAVKDGDITTHKQYQDLLARYNAERAAREKAEQAREESRKIANTIANQRDEEHRRASEAEKQRDGARNALQAAKLRGDKLKAENDALKAHPIEAQVVDEEEINRRAQARADELTAPLREELEALRARHPADPEEAEQAMRDAYDSTLYTGRAIENAWRTLRPLLSFLDAARREQALRQLNKTISQIQGEIVQCL